MLKWSRMSFLALTVGLALVGFKHEPISGSIMAFFGLLLLCRSYYIYNRRLALIKAGDIHGNWSDDISSHVLMGMLIIPATKYLCPIYNIRFHRLVTFILDCFFLSFQTAFGQV